jgi:hypothetical protein
MDEGWRMSTEPLFSRSRLGHDGIRGQPGSSRLWNSAPSEGPLLRPSRDRLPILIWHPESSRHCQASVGGCDDLGPFSDNPSSSRIGPRHGRLADPGLGCATPSRRVCRTKASYVAGKFVSSRQPFLGEKSQDEWQSLDAGYGFHSSHGIAICRSDFRCVVSGVPLFHATYPFASRLFRGTVGRPCHNNVAQQLTPQRW